MIINMQSGGVVPERIIDAQTITPGTADQVMAAGTYLRGALTVAGDADLIPENIAQGVDIFGITGNFKGKFALNSITMAETNDSGTITFEHSLEKIPNNFLLVLDVPHITYSGYNARVTSIACNALGKQTKETISISTHDKNYIPTESAVNSMAVIATENSITLQNMKYSGSGNLQFVIGDKYKLITWREE